MKTQWKRRASQTGLAALMATMVFGALGSANAAEADGTAQQTQPLVKVQLAQPAINISTVSGYQAIGPSLLMQPAFQRNYLKLLVATYAPETSSDWKQALDERKQLESQLPQMTATKIISIVKKSDNTAEEGKTANGEAVITESHELNSIVPMVRITTSEKDIPADSSATTKRIHISTLKDGDVMKDVVQALPVEGIAEADIMKVELPESFKRQQKLAEAVDADDAATIRSLLPELLTDYKKETESLRTLIQNLKKDEAPQQP